MVLLTFAEFMGRFHPVLVHLPIGILLLACFFQLLGSATRYAGLLSAIPAIIFWGALSAVASCISGFLLASDGGYEESIVDQHQWMGIGVAVLAILFYLLHKISVKRSVIKVVSLLLVVLVTITGHLGGSITHGDDFLTSALHNDGKSGNALPPIEDIQHAAIYNDVVQPLLEARCYSCHGTGKQKGKLRLDSREHILKGGENGKAVTSRKPDESAMVERLLLPLENDEHMPPKGKPQLTENQISLLRWWIKTGADFEKKVNELDQDEKIKPVLLSLQSGTSSLVQEAEIPEQDVGPADAAAIGKLKRAGVVVSPVRQNSNYLSVNFIAADSSGDDSIKMLKPLEKQLLWLKLDHSRISDKAMQTLANCKMIRRLSLSHTNITDKGLSGLQNLDQLRSLNLVGTSTTAQGIMALKKLKNLKNMFVYQTEINTGEWLELKKLFPETNIDSGKYVVPTLATDTTLLRLSSK